MNQMNVFDFFNTIAAQKPELEAYNANANRQEIAIVNWFHRHDAGSEYSPSYVHADLITRGLLPHATPLTSIRRAISNLTRKRILEKTSLQVPGPYGKPENCWRLANSV